MAKEILIIFVGFINLILGLFVYLKNKRDNVSRSFFIFTFVVCLWSIFLFFYMCPIIGSSLFWIKTTFFFALLSTPSLFYFICVFIKKDRSYYLRSIIIYYIIAAPLAWALLSTDLIIKDISSFDENIQTIVGGGLYIFFLFLMVFYVLWSFFLLIKQYFKSQKIEKNQVSYILLGLLLFAVPGITFDVILPVFFHNTAYFWISPLFLIFPVFFTFLAILRYHLFSVKVILTEMLVGIMGILLLIQVFLAPTLTWRISSIAIFLFFCFLGHQLINYSHEEEKKREEAEKLAIRERALRERAEKIANEYKRLDETKTMFLSLASHQLRTPLSSMKGYLELALSGNYGKVEGKAREFIESVEMANEREINLVNDLLDLNKLQTGKLQFSFQDNVQLEDIIEEVVKEFQPEAQKYNLYLKFNKPQHPLPKITADPQKLREVILNLIDNALKYTKEGGVTINLQSKDPNTILPYHHSRYRHGYDTPRKRKTLPTI